MTTTEPRTDDHATAAHRRDARPLRRASPDVRPREPLLRRGLRGAARRPGYLDVAVPDRVRRRRPRPRRVRPAGPPPRLPTHRPPRWPSTCTSTGPASPPTCCAPATTRVVGPRDERPPARSSPPSTARPATTSRCCCRARRAERVDGGWSISGHKIFGSLSPVWTLRRLPRHGHLRPGRAAHRARLPAPRHRRPPDRRDVGHPRHAGHAEPGHGARQGVRARRARRARVPGRLRRRRAVPGVDLRLGPARLRRRLPRRRRAGVRHHRRADARSAPRSP